MHRIEWGGNPLVGASTGSAVIGLLTLVFLFRSERTTEHECTAVDFFVIKTDVTSKMFT